MIIPTLLVVQLKFYVVADPPTTPSFSTPLRTSDRSKLLYLLCARLSNFLHKQTKAYSHAFPFHPTLPELNLNDAFTKIFGMAELDCSM